MPIVPVSALNHYLYCRRRCALIHVEGIFEENVYTLEGRFAHERSDQPRDVVVDGIRTIRALSLWSHAYGLSGKADTVEIHGKVPYPVDHKRGKKRQHSNDDVQLCGQALCLEEMFQVKVPAGAVFHAGSRRRREVVFDSDLRSRTAETIQDVRDLLRSARLPGAAIGPRCNGCSLRDTCLPDVSASRVERWCRALFEPQEEPR